MAEVDGYRRGPLNGTAHGFRSPLRDLQEPESPRTETEASTEGVRPPHAPDRGANDGGLPLHPSWGTRNIGPAHQEPSAQHRRGAHNRSSTRLASGAPQGADVGSRPEGHGEACSENVGGICGGDPEAGWRTARAG